jgi:hypothetical protein
MIKFCTFFSKSHTALYKEFMNSFPYEEDVDLIIRYMPQESDGIYESETWNKTMYKKIAYIVDYLKSMNENDLFIHSDIDIRFYRNFKDDIIKILEHSGKDILFQNDGYELCMGFFVCKRNEKIIKMMEYVRDNLNKYPQDQKAVNVLLPQTSIKYGKLPERYYNYGPYNGFKRWKSGVTDFYVPQDIILHHANWTVGVEDKINIINIVKNIHNTQTKK